MIDWETLGAFIAIDTIVHFIVGLVFLPLGAKFIEFWALKKYGGMLKEKSAPKTSTVEDVLE